MSREQSDRGPWHGSRRGRMLKRAFDVGGSLLLIGVATPAWALAAVLVRLTSQGPVFYRLRAIGRDGKPFDMLKFRTMVPNAESLVSGLADRNQGSGPMLKVSEDPRITSAGRWLRRLSVDEIPQLWNVVRGEMSLVGPRPLGARLYEKRWMEEPFRRRLDVPPGITGLWQVSGRSQDFEECCRLDVQYIDNWSLRLDLLLLARTLPAVLRGVGAT